MGSTLSKLRGPVNPNVPSYVSLCYKTRHVPWGDPGQAGYLGNFSRRHFVPMADGKDDMVLEGVTLERLQDRKSLLGSFDQFRRELDNSGAS